MLDRLEKNKSLKPFSGYRTGGWVEYYFEPESDMALGEVLQFLQEHNMPWHVVGLGANTLFTDGMLKGVLISLRKPFYCQISKNEKGNLLVGGGVKNISLSEYALREGVQGFEFLASFPGTLGGSVFGNAGKPGEGIVGKVESLKGVTSNGEYKTLNSSELEYSYRCFHTLRKSKMIVTEIEFKALPGDREIIKKDMDYYIEVRKGKHPKGRCCGSVFVNPEGTYSWKILDQLGLRGFEKGGACFSEKHPNWILASSSARSKDIFDLIKLAERRAKNELGVEMRNEVRIIGEF